MSKNTSMIIISLILGAFAFSPFNLYILGFLFISPFFIFLIKTDNLKKLLIGSFVFSFIFMTLTAYVVFEPFLFTISSIVFLGLPLSFFAVKKMFGEKTATISLPFLWTAWDLLRAYCSFLPFTVLTAGNTLGMSPFVGIASAGGLTILTLFSATINLLIALIILKTNTRDFKKTILLSGITILLILSGYLFSIINLQNNSTSYSKLSNHLNVAAVSISPNFDSAFEIFKNDDLSPKEMLSATNMIQETIEPIKRELTEQIINKNIDLIIFPEDMIDITITNSADKEAYQKYRITNAGLLIDAYRKMAMSLNTNLLSVMTTVRDGKRRISSVLFNKNGEISGVYDKSILTIGSEYWPFGSWRPFYYDWVGKIFPDIKDDSPIFNQKYSYQKGLINVLKNNDIPAIGSPICVEILYPEQTKRFEDLGAKIIIHSSSNVWTVNSGLNTYLKLVNRIRTIESVWLKIPIIFNGRNEMAGLITPDGKIKTIPYGTNKKNYGIGFETVNF